MQFCSSEGLQDVRKTISRATNYSPTAESVVEANKVKRREASPPADADASNLPDDYKTFVYVLLG